LQLRASYYLLRMDKLLVLSLCLFFSLPSYIVAHNQRVCGSDLYHDYLYNKYPELKEAHQRDDAHLDRKIREGALNNKRQTVYTIPTVVHVIYNNANDNLNDNLIYDQIARLNRDFRRLNSDQTNTLAQFQGVAGDAQIQFILAQTDPNGLTTTGVTRSTTATALFPAPGDGNFNNDCQRAATGGVDAWDRTRYMNLWVCRMGGSILGYAQRPGGPAATDGVVISTDFFGAQLAAAPYNLGRTVTHEVGHWFNLLHMWGNNQEAGCSEDDLVTDTPVALGPNYGCTLNAQSCNVLNMVQNYMDYTDDACMNLFTDGQISRMRIQLVSGSRTALPISYSGPVPGVSDNYTEPVSTTGFNIGGNGSSDDLIDLPFRIPGLPTWALIVIIVVAAILVLAFIIGCVKCLCGRH